MSRTFTTLRKHVTELFKNKFYMIALAFTAVFSYGFLITHSTVGIDDTPYSYYFEEGLNVIIGRWTLYLINKFFSVAEYAPFFTDLAGVLVLVFAVTVWAALFRDILEEKFPIAVYLVFAAVFLSCPLISEVYTYHLHNGISLGYLAAGVSLWFYRGSLDRHIVRHKKPGNPADIPGKCSCMAMAVLFLWIAIGCYESMMIVWLLGVCLLLLTEKYAEEDRKQIPNQNQKRKVVPAVLWAFVTVLGSMVLRSVMREIFIVIFRLQALDIEGMQRSTGEMLAWLGKKEAFAEFAMAVKRSMVMYGVFAYAYLPIRVFVCAAVILLLFGLAETIRRKNFFMLLLAAASLFSCFLLVPVEGKVTLYRAAQFLPVMCGYGMMVLAGFLWRISGKWMGKKKHFKIAGKVMRALGTFFFAALLWNQCFDMNHWFYVDYLKYEEAKRVAAQIYADLGAEFDVGKPLVFTGRYTVPQSIIESAYVPYNSELFFRMGRITGGIDEQLLEKFYHPYGVWVAQTPELSVIEWGRRAFDTEAELVTFFRMHGYEITQLSGTDYYPMEIEAMDMPGYPEQGYIRDCGDYIIVNF